MRIGEYLIIDLQGQDDVFKINLAFCLLNSEYIVNQSE